MSYLWYLFHIHLFVICGFHGDNKPFSDIFWGPFSFREIPDLPGPFTPQPPPNKTRPPKPAAQDPPETYEYTDHEPMGCSTKRHPNKVALLAKETLTRCFFDRSGGSLIPQQETQKSCEKKGDLDQLQQQQQQHHYSPLVSKPKHDYHVEIFLISCGLHRKKKTWHMSRFSHPGSCLLKAAECRNFLVLGLPPKWCFV